MPIMFDPGTNRSGLDNQIITHRKKTKIRTNITAGSDSAKLIHTMKNILETGTKIRELFELQTIYILFFSVIQDMRYSSCAKPCLSLNQSINISL